MLYVGTSGFSYKEWKGRFYPQSLAAKDMLSYYSRYLKAVELNNTFYRMPKPELIETWKTQVPDDFRFSIKAPRSITQFRRLKDASALTNSLLETVSVLDDRLGALLFRLPEDMKKDLARLEAFLEELPPEAPAVFDFRHPTWFDDDVWVLLRSHNRVLCVSDTDETPVTNIDKTADWGYVRLRRVNYSDAELAMWLSRIKKQKWKDTYVFFKHEDEGTGPKLAARFMALSK